tara:strand:- start:523 stop:1560 length:1038 start_codon:yes stop_codon:yes gene_type:complete
MKTLHIYSNRHIKDKVKTIKKGDWIYLENSFSKKRWSLYFRANNINEKELNITYITQEEFFNLSLEEENKFDNVVGNQPYHYKKPGHDKSTMIWHLFIPKAFDIVKTNGTVSLINPPLWRKPDGVAKIANKVLFSKQLLDISCHSFEEGYETFGAGTAYDSWTAKNCDPTELTNVRFQDGEIAKVDLTSTNFMPSGYYSEIKSLITDNVEERVNFIFSRSGYGSDKPNMSIEKTDKFSNPCVYTITKNKINLWYSDTAKNGHFDIPKVIWTNGSGTRPIVDNDGEYGVMQFGYAIADDPENLENIAKALASEKMKKLMSCNLFTNGIYNNTIIKMFKKDFWKEFV